MRMNRTPTKNPKGSDKQCSFLVPGVPGVPVVPGVPCLCCLDHSREFGVSGEARLLRDEPAVFQDDEVRDPPHVEPGRERWLAFGVHFEDHGLAGHLARDLLDARCGRPARPAPRGPEVDQHGDSCPRDDLLEGRLVCVQRLGHRTESRLAAAASPDLGLLLGDWCYAEGLCTIADHGELDDIAELARLVADVSARANERIADLDPRWDEATAAMATPRP